ncbi:hypothetical protein acdb102_43470 [Acidothermaceae bacterium B102]|nr:hypothetical protein acdb102_43470 [Acidothermaceae bacterium B102]
MSGRLSTAVDIALALSAESSHGRLMPPSSLDRKAFVELLRDQDGLIAARQAPSVGLSSSALSRRVKSGHLRRVLPLVYAEGVADLSDRQRVRAALLFGGGKACLTGEAALIWRRVQHLPREVSAQTVDILVPASRHLTNNEWVRVTRTARMPFALLVDDVPTASMARAVVDATRWLESYESALATISSVINAGRTTLEDVRAEAVLMSVRGSRLVRAVLAEASAEVRSVAEADARRLFQEHGLPEPDVNEPLTVQGETFVPDFRWGWVIVEIDSRAWHLLEAGAWERTQARRARLEAAGYRVLPYTPQQIRDTPLLVIAGIVHALRLQAAS